MPSTSGPSSMGSIMPRLGWLSRMGPVREVSGAELLATYDDPFVRHQTDPDRITHAYVGGGATWIESLSHLPGHHGRNALGLGTAEGLAGLLARIDVRAGRASIPVAVAAALPRRWRPEPVKHWHWMATRTRPDLPDLPVEEVGDPDEVNALLDAHAPDAHVRPGSPRVECWLGVRAAGGLVALGALQRQHDGTGHLRAVTVAADLRGGGIGGGLSAALTRRALDGPSGLATLGVYTDNAPAMAVYRRLSY